MSDFGLIQAHHLERKAVIYIRQSSNHQVLTNTESRRMQHAMKEHAQQLGWRKEQILTVETDTGTSASSTAGRQAYKDLVSEIALGNIGVILSYESARLSRNCSDWYPLLDVCALKYCLIADRDGLYDPATPNGRLLLGMKGILSEVELHTLRTRLIAGVQNKARRAELALALPAGLVRLEDGRVVKEPDIQIQQCIENVLRTFLEVKSTSKVVRHFRQNHLRVPKRHRNARIVWQLPSVAGIASILRNPAYAGAFAYGKTRTLRPMDGCSRPTQRRRPMEEWTVLVKDRYPAYISWEVFEQIQATLKDNYAQYDRNRTRGVPRNGAALLQGLVYCGACGHKMVVQYKGGTRYLCNYHRAQMQQPICQLLPADPVDAVVVNAFFQALAPAELDLYECTAQSRKCQAKQVEIAQQRELQRLRYEVELARRQYDRVDPDNRLVASELERRWESALRALTSAEEEFGQLKTEHEKVVPLCVSKELRIAFSALGRTLPTLWAGDRLNRIQRKSLLRCVIDKVVIHRKDERELVGTRIVWRGGATSEFDVPIHVGSVRELSGFKAMEARLLELESEGRTDEQIAALLSEQGFRSPLSDTVLPSTVKTIRLHHQRIHRFHGPRPRHVPAGFLSIPQISQCMSVNPHWIYHLIKRGVIQIQRDPQTRLYLFPDCPEMLEDLRLLRDGKLARVSTRREHQDV